MKNCLYFVNDVKYLKINLSLSKYKKQYYNYFIIMNVKKKQMFLL